MYEMLFGEETILIVQGGRVVFTLRRDDVAFATNLLTNLNHPELNPEA